jgi:hypothetical protein
MYYVETVTNFDVQYANFVTLEDNMFVTRIQNREAVSYAALNRPVRSLPW